MYRAFVRWGIPESIRDCVALLCSFNLWHLITIFTIGTIYASIKAQSSTESTRVRRNKSYIFVTAPWLIKIFLINTCFQTNRRY
jgi:hypothetical protein